MPSVRDIAAELGVPAAWIIASFMYSGARKTLSSQLTDEEIALIRDQAPRWKDGDPPLRGHALG